MKKKKDIFIDCPVCHYKNKLDNVKRYGSCKLCETVLDNKAKYRYEMYCRLHLWSKKGTGFYEIKKI